MRLTPVGPCGAVPAEGKLRAGKPDFDGGRALFAMQREYVPAPSVDDSLAMTLLLLALSATAGSVDVIGFLGMDHLFIAHITGNLVILAARLAAGNEASVAHLISVPVFITALALVKLLATLLERMRIASLLPLLMLQFVLLAAFLAICIAAAPPVDPNAAGMVVAGMLGVCAMAVQNALVQISLKGAPSTAVMTTNVTRFVLDLGDAVLGRSSEARGKARERARPTGLATAGFLVGCILGAAAEATVGLASLVLPAGLALAALALGVAASLSSTRTLSV
jgi:uncharacterized membrane protein YoaK (UPF0700 family)